MTGTLQPCSPCVRYSYPGYGGSMTGYGPPVVPPSAPLLNWKYTDMNYDQVWMWSANKQSWGC